MWDLQALKRQHRAIKRAADELHSSLNCLVFDYEQEIGVLSGERAMSIEDTPGMRPLHIGLTWSAREEPGMVIATAEELIETMRGLGSGDTQEPTLDAFKSVPQADWDEYERLCNEYDELRRQRIRKLAEIKAIWTAKIRPHLRAGKNETN